LKKRASAIDRITQAERKLIDNMIETMEAADGAGLAAPQVGVAKRIFVFRRGDDIHALINPKIIARSPEQVIGSEGCLSIPGVQAKVSRAARVTVQGRNEKNKLVTIECEDNEDQGRAATCVQHELDHLDGVLYLERADPETISWLIEGEDEDGEETVFLDPTTPEEVLASIKAKKLPDGLHAPAMLRQRVTGKR
jgi:peptide deformylase